MFKIRLFILCLMCMTYHGPYHMSTDDFSNPLLTNRDKCSILFFINEFRNELANGKTPQVPKKSNMMRVHWDEDLSLDAMMRLSATYKDSAECIDVTPTDGSVKGEADASGGNEKALEEILIKWTKGKFNYSNSVKPEKLNLDDRIRTRMKYQMELLSARSTRVGCGAVVADKTYILLCYFDPPEGLDEQPLHQEGSPGSRCAEGSTVCNIWPALCTVGKDRGCLSGSPEDDDMCYID